MKLKWEYLWAGLVYLPWFIYLSYLLFVFSNVYTAHVSNIPLGTVKCLKSLYFKNNCIYCPKANLCKWSCFVCQHLSKLVNHVHRKSTPLYATKNTVFFKYDTVKYFGCVHTHPLCIFSNKHCSNVFHITCALRTTTMLFSSK